MERWTLLFRVLFFDVLIPLVKFGLLIYSVVQLFTSGDSKWGAATVGAIIAPGLLEVVYWLMVCCCDPERRAEYTPWKWILFFNPITFPFTVIFWNAKSVLNVEEFKQNFPMLLVLNSIQSFTETAAITILQLVIITTTWNTQYKTVDVFSEAISAIGPQTIDKNAVTRWVQVASAVLAVINLAKDYSRHHFHELSAKQGVPDFWESLKGLFFYVLVILCRIPSLVLLALFFRPYFFIILLVFVVTNIALSVCILGRNPYKSLWTGFASVLAPTCFVAREEVPEFSHPGRSFLKFYFFNALAFLLLTLSSHILADVYFSLNGTITTNPDLDILNFLMESFSRVPFIDTKCLPNYAGCPHVISAIALSFSIVELILLKTVTFCYPGFLGQNLPTLQTV